VPKPRTITLDEMTERVMTALRDELELCEKHLREMVAHDKGRYSDTLYDDFRRAQRWGFGAKLMANRLLGMGMDAQITALHAGFEARLEALMPKEAA
jgi:hypothetical protein